LFLVEHSKQDPLFAFAATRFETCNETIKDLKGNISILCGIKCHKRHQQSLSFEKDHVFEVLLDVFGVKTKDERKDELHKDKRHRNEETDEKETRPRSICIRWHHNIWIVCCHHHCVKLERRLPVVGKVDVALWRSRKHQKHENRETKHDAKEEDENLEDAWHSQDRFDRMTQ